MHIFHYVRVIKYFHQVMVPDFGIVVGVGSVARKAISQASTTLDPPPNYKKREKNNLPWVIIVVGVGSVSREGFLRPPPHSTHPQTTKKERKE